MRLIGKHVPVFLTASSSSPGKREKKNRRHTFKAKEEELKDERPLIYIFLLWVFFFGFLFLGFCLLWRCKSPSRVIWWQTTLSTFKAERCTVHRQAGGKRKRPGVLAKSTKREPRPIQRKTNARHLTSPLSLDAFTLWTRYIDLVASVRCPSIIVSRNDFRSVLDNNAHEQRGRHKNIAHPVLASTSYVNITYAIVLFVFFKWYIHQAFECVFIYIYMYT